MYCYKIEYYGAGQIIRTAYIYAHSKKEALVKLHESVKAYEILCCVEC